MVLNSLKLMCFNLLEREKKLENNEVRESQSFDLIDVAKNIAKEKGISSRGSNYSNGSSNRKSWQDKIWL